jgi:long-chain acyl-CoA synthetase
MIAVPDVASIYNKVREVGPDAGIEKIVMCPLAPILPTLQSLGWRVLKRREHARYHEDDLHIGFFRLIERKPNCRP